jgi:protein-tyrosine phosphatase
LSTIDGSGLTDLHSHLVPGVDDGARTLDDALEGLGRLWDAGVRTVVTTPHLDGSVTRSPGQLEVRLEEIDVGWETLKAGAAEAFPSLALLRGQEVMLDIPDPVLTDSRVRLAETSYVLVEWPRLQVPPATGPVLSRLGEMGVKIVLAHPERYHGLDAEMALPGEWRRMGALLQVNYGSLLGRYGDGPRKRAFTLLERGWVDLFSTDFHGRPHLQLYIREAAEVLEEMGGLHQFDILSRVNPARLLQGTELLPIPPLSGKRPRGLRERVRDLLMGREQE